MERAADAAAAAFGNDPYSDPTYIDKQAETANKTANKASATPNKVKTRLKTANTAATPSVQHRQNSPLHPPTNTVNTAPNTANTAPHIPTNSQYSAAALTRPTEGGTSFSAVLRSPRPR